MRLTQEVIDDIRNSASISEVIGHYIPLTKKGKGYVANCPFHDDHDPSLKISEDKQIYRCFACGNGGNVFTFVMNYKKVPFKEAVKEVAKEVVKETAAAEEAPAKAEEKPAAKAAKTTRTTAKTTTTKKAAAPKKPAAAKKPAEKKAPAKAAKK